MYQHNLHYACALYGKNTVLIRRYCHYNFSHRCLDWYLVWSKNVVVSNMNKV